MGDGVGDIPEAKDVQVRDVGGELTRNYLRELPIASVRKMAQPPRPHPRDFGDLADWKRVGSRLEHVLHLQRAKYAQSSRPHRRGLKLEKLIEVLRYVVGGMADQWLDQPGSRQFEDRGKGKSPASIQLFPGQRWNVESDPFVQQNQRGKREGALPICEFNGPIDIRVEIPGVRHMSSLSDRGSVRGYELELF